MKRCLIVDDSKVIRMIARNMLQEFGFETLEAENGQEALTACEAAFPDAILLDWNMPVMNGIEFLEEAKKNPSTAEIPVVIISTEGREEDTQRGLEAGAVAYIKKPFQNEQILDVISQVKEGSAA